MKLLTSTSDLLQVVTTAIANVLCHVDYADLTAGPAVAMGRVNTPAITTATTTTILGSPAASTSRNAVQVSLRNSSATSCGVTVQHTDGTTVVPIVSATLLQNESLVLAENGIWTHFDANGAPYTANTGGFIGLTVLTTGTAFTTSPRTRTIRVRVQGGGGGGGGGNTAASSAGVGSGGGCGSYAEKVFAVSPNTAYTYAIGAAGTAGAAAGGTGGNGGSSTFAVGGTTVTAPGGTGGPGQATAAATPLITAGGAGGAIATNGDLNGAGRNGGAAERTNATIAKSGAGGDSAFGRGGLGLVAQGAGTAAIGFGAGGAGGACINGGAAAAGGAGTAGVILVEEFA